MVLQCFQNACFFILVANSWVLVSSISKVSDGWMRDLRFNFCLHQKLIDILIWWWKVIIKSGCHKLKLSQKKKKSCKFKISDVDCRVLSHQKRGKIGGALWIICLVLLGKASQYWYLATKASIRVNKTRKLLVQMINWRYDPFLAMAAIIWVEYL